MVYHTRLIERTIQLRMKDELQNFIFDELVFCADSKQFGPNDDLLEAGLDSMGIMRLVLYIEENFGVILPDEEIQADNVRTLNALEQWIRRHSTA